MSAITAKASRKMKKYAVLTREPRCFLGSFDFSWEQRKLGDMMNVTSVKRIHQSDWTDSGVRFLRARDIVAAAKNEEPDDYLYISKEKYEEYSALSGKVGVSDLLVTGVGTIGVPYLVRNLEPLYFKDGNIIWFQNSSRIDGKFLFYSFSAEQIQGFINESAGIGTVGTYTIESGKKTPISLPNQIEQARVGEFFQQLDNLITLHQRKCALLFSPFQALISMMFTTSTFSWEQRKLGEIGSVSMCRRIFKEQTSETGDIPFYKIGTFGVEPDAFISRELFEEYKSKYPYPKKGDILISASGSIGRTVEFAGNDEYFQDSNIVWLSHDERLSNPFLKCFYSVVKWAGIEGSTIKRLYNDNILNTVICMPSVPEQECIGAFFENLDNLITLHQRECISFTGRAGSLILTANKKRTTSSWEQRKFSDITFLAGEKNRDNLPLESYSITNEHGFVPQDEKFENGGTMREADKRMYYIVSPNSFAYNPARINVGSIGYQNVGKNVIVSSLYEVFKTSEDVDDRLLWHWFKSPDFQKLIMQLQEGGVRLYFYYDKLCMGEVSLPSLEEQRKIGKLFDTLDNLITLHQRKPFLMKWRTSDANRNQTNRLVL